MKSRLLVIIPFLFLGIITKGGVEDKKPVQICWIAGCPEHHIHDVVSNTRDINNSVINSVNYRNKGENFKNIEDITVNSGNVCRFSEYRSY